MDGFLAMISNLWRCLTVYEILLPIQNNMES